MIAPNPKHPYPFLDGKYVIDRSNLPKKLRNNLEEAVHLDAMARGSRRVADSWKREGRAETLVEGLLKLAAAYEQSRNQHLAHLWTHHGKKPPRDLGLDQLRIIGE